MAKTNTVKEMIHANGIDINIYTLDFENDYISLTDIARKREGEYPGYVIQNWLRGKNTVAFLGLWESCTILSLIASNSRRLKMRRVLMDLFLHQKGG